PFRWFIAALDARRAAVRPPFQARYPSSELVGVAARLFPVAVGGRDRLLGRHGHLLGRYLARDERDVDLVAGLAVFGPRAADEDRGAGLELASEHEVGQRILDEALDRAAQRPGAHRRVVALVDEQLLRLVG